MVAVDIELAHDLRRDAILGASLNDENGPQRVNAARGGCARREVFENLDRLCDRRDRDPFRRFTCALLALVRDRAYAMAHDQAIIAAGERQTARAHGLYLTIAHAGEVGADDIGCSLQHALFVEKGL